MQSQNSTSHCRYLAAVLSIVALASAQSAPKPPKPTSDDQLKKVLERLDRAASEFRSATADFEWDQYQKIVDETEKQLGKVYFRKSNGETQMAADVTDPPPPKTVVLTGGKVQLYQPKPDQLDVYDATKSNESVESFLVLGFGGSGRDMVKSFDVTYGGTENIGGENTDKLELIPKGEKLRAMFNHIELWIDARGISIQQKLTSPEGDYRLNRYSNILLKTKIPDSVFKPKTTGKTRVATH